MADDAGRLNELLTETSFLYGVNAGFVEDLYGKWAADPASVEPSWRSFFASLADGVLDGLYGLTGADGDPGDVESEPGFERIGRERVVEAVN